MVDLDKPWEVAKANILYKCGWSPFEGHNFSSKIKSTYVNGNLVFNNDENLIVKKGDINPKARKIFECWFFKYANDDEMS